MNSLRAKTVKGMQWSVLGTFGNAVLQMVVMIIITRLIAPEEFGVLAMAQLFVQFAVFFANFGVGTAILRKEKLDDDHIAAGFWCALVISLLIALIMYFLAPLSHHLLDSPKITNVVKLLALNFFVMGFGIVSMSLLQREMRFGFLALVTIISYVLGYGLVGLPLALKGHGVYSLVLCMLTQSILKVIAQYIAVRHKVRPTSKVHIYKETLSFGGQHSIAGFISFLGTSVDRFILGRWGGASILGIYSRSSQLISHPVQMLSGSVMRVLFPGFSSIQKDSERMRVNFIKSMSIMALVLVPIACFASITSRDLILVAYGNEWINGWPALAAYAWIAPFIVLGMVAMMVNDIIGKQIYRIRIHLEAFFLFVVAIWFGLKFGIVGVSIGVVLGHFYRFIFTGVLVGKLLQIKKVILAKIFIWPVIVGLVSVLVPVSVLLFGSDLTAAIRLLLSITGGGLSVIILVASVRIPPLILITDIVEDGYPALKPMLMWIRK